MTGPVNRPIPTVRQIQAELGLSFGYAAIARRLMIVDDPRISEAMLAKRINLAQADQIAKLPHEARAEALANPQAIKNAQAHSDELPRLRARVAELEAEVCRLGEMIAAQKETVGLNTGGRPTQTPRDERGVSEKPTLDDAGISYDLSSRAQKRTGGGAS